MTSQKPRTPRRTAVHYGFVRDDEHVRRLLNARDRLTVAEEQERRLNRWKLWGPILALVFVALVFTVTTVAGVRPSVIWFAVFGALFAGAVWCIMAAAWDSQRREVNRSQAIHDGALMTAAHKGVHLEAVHDTAGY